MFLQHGKRFIFLAVFGLLIGSQTIAAQHIISEQRAASDEFDSSNAKIEKPIIEMPDFNLTDDTSERQSFALNGESGELTETDDQAKIKDIKYQFRAVEMNARHLDFDAETKVAAKKIAPLEDFSARSGEQLPDTPDTDAGSGFNYRGAIKQSLLFLGVQHGYAVLGQAKTRRALKHGAFFRDYADSVKSLHGWSDGGRFFTNYIAHPMQGSLTGFIYVQNSPQATRQQFGKSGVYWKSRMKAMLWTAAWSTQFEIGPVSQASIGNVGLKGKQTWEDIVTTPTLGTAMLITEDAVDRFIMQRIERRTDNFYVKIFSRMLLNPTRVFANLLRFKPPWHRDRPYAR